MTQPLRPGGLSELRVWKHRYHLRPRWTAAGNALYDLDKLAAILANQEARRGRRPPDLGPTWTCWRPPDTDWVTARADIC